MQVPEIVCTDGCWSGDQLEHKKFCFWVWRSPVACLHGVQEVVGSNPATQTKKPAQKAGFYFVTYFIYLLIVRVVV